MKKILAITLALLCLAFAFAACDKNDKADDGDNSQATQGNALLGTWFSVEDKVEMIYAFYEDGTGYIKGMGVTTDTQWRVDKNKLVIVSYPQGQEYVLFDGTWRMSKQQLVLSMEGNTVVFTRR